MMHKCKHLLLLILLFAVSVACSERKLKDKIVSKIKSELNEQLGVDLNLEGLDDVEKNAVSVSFRGGGLEHISPGSSLFGLAMLDEGTMNFVLTTESSKIIIGFSADDLFSRKPIQGYFGDREYEDVLAQFVVYGTDTQSDLDYLGNSRSAFEGTATIRKLTEEYVEIDLDGKIGKVHEIEQPGVWEDFSGKVTLSHPVWQMNSINKAEIFGK